MVNFSDTILVIGGGSIGERHINNLLNQGYSQVAVLRKRNLPFRNPDLNNIKVVTSEAEALLLKPKAAIICTPTSMHAEQTIWCLQYGMHVLVEKPVSHNLDQWAELKKAVQNSGKLLYVGYMMRFHPLVIKMREIIENKSLGKLISFTSHWGEYLPNWHPWEDYRNSYAAKSELGGGASLTLSHDLDLVNYLASNPLTEYYQLQNHASTLEVTAVAGADFLLKYANGTTGHVHLNYFEQPSNRFLHLIFANGRLEFYFLKNELHILTPNRSEIIKTEKFERNQLFESELKHFFSLIESNDIKRVSENMLDESETIIKVCLNLPIENQKHI